MSENEATGFHAPESGDAERAMRLRHVARAAMLVAELLDPPDTRSRIDRRDDAIRAAVQVHYRSMAPTTAAMALADDLLAVDMRRSPRCKAARDELATILALNSGGTLAWRRIYEIIRKNC